MKSSSCEFKGPCVKIIATMGIASSSGRVGMIDTETKIGEFERVSKSVLEMLQRGVLLTGAQENTLVDTIHDLGIGYGEWLKQTSQKEQSYPPDEPR